MQIISKGPKSVLTLVVMLMVVLFGGGCKGSGESLPTSDCVEENYVGRVSDTQNWPIADAKVSFLADNTSPIVVYTDSEGTYRFKACVQGEPLVGEIRVVADGYKPYNRNVTLQSNTLLIDEVRLTPVSDLEGTPSPTQPLPLFTAAATLTTNVTPTSVPRTPAPAMHVPVAKKPILISPAQGQTYTNAIQFEWNGTLYSGQFYQVTALNMRTGRKEQSDMLRNSTWTVSISADQFGEWHWSVAVIQNGQKVTESDEGMFWFKPYSSQPSTSPLSP